MRQGPHCKLVTKLPAVATTGFQSKLNFVDDILERTVLLQRQIPWKAFFPPFGTGGGTGTGGDTGGGIDTGGGGGGIGGGDTGGIF